VNKSEGQGMRDISIKFINAKSQETFEKEINYLLNTYNARVASVDVSVPDNCYHALIIISEEGKNEL